MTSPGNRDWPKKKYSSEHERKCHKPILEKKRRARINKSLDQLKSLLLETMKGEAGHFSKLEKADILEMTVKHLQDLQQSQLKVAMAIDPTVKQKYHSGYDECTNEVDRYLSTVDGLQSDVKKRLMDHLDLCNRQQSNVFPAHSHTSTLSAFQNLSRVSPGTSTIHPGTLVGPVSPPMYHSLLDMNKSHDASSDRMLHEYNKMTETSPNYHMLSKSLQLSTNKTQFRDRVQHGSEYPKEKPHTITRQKKLSENKDCIENNRQVQSPALLRQRISGTHIVGKENSTNNKELCPQNDCVRRFGENQPRPFGELNLNSFNNRINQTRSNETNKQNVSGRSSVSGSVAMVKEESMWRPW